MLESIKQVYYKTPDWLFASTSNYLHVLPKKDKIIIIPKSGGWLVLRDDMRFFSPTAKFFGHSLKTFEKRFEQVLKINYGDTVVDVGACLGETTIPSLIKVGKKGFVIAVEPEPNNVRYLKVNTSGFNNVQIIEKAAWYRKEKLKFYISESVAGHSIIGKSPIYIEVEADTLDNMIKQKVDFLKLDVQGTELQALEGAERLLESVKKLVVETHGLATKNTAPGVIEFLKQRKFNIKVITEKYVLDNTFFEVVHAWKD